MSEARKIIERGDAGLRFWLEHVAQTAIDWLDLLDAQAEDLEDEELGDDAAWG